MYSIDLENEVAQVAGYQQHVHYRQGSRVFARYAQSQKNRFQRLKQGEAKVLELKDWVKQVNFAAKPWLLFGKGPTFSRRGEFDLENFNKFALNHVVREQKVEIAHIIDVDVVESCAEVLLTNCDWLLVPRILNVKSYPSQYLSLTDWCQCLPVLAALNKAGRLVTYDFSHSDSDDPWTIVARYFSSEAALGILGRLGAKTVHSLGIDGGTRYSQDFDDLKARTLLANGQQNFDIQFERLREIADQCHIQYSALLAPPPAMAPANAGSMPAVVEAAPADNPTVDSTLPAKLQTMEQEIRDLRSELKARQEELQTTVKELKIATDRLGWANDEISEYRARVVSMEKNLHTLYSSKTWKLGRVFTKPAALLKKGLPKS